MTNFTNSNDALVQTFATKKKETNAFTETLGPSPVAKRNSNQDFSPVIPDVKINTELPVGVRQSLAETQIVQRANRSAQRERNLDLIKQQSKTTDVLNDADSKIENSNNNFFGDLIGLFNDDYDVSEQKRRKVQAVRNFQTAAQIGELKASTEKLREKDAAAEFTAYSQTQKLKAQGLAFSTAEMNNIVASNSARKAAQDFAFSQFEVSELETIRKTGSFNTVVTEQRVNKYFMDQQEAQLEFQSAALAFQSDKIDFGLKLEEKALRSSPVNFLRNQLKISIDTKQPRVELSKGYFVAPSKVQAMIAEKDKKGDAFRESEAKRAVSLAKNDGVFNSAQKAVGVLSSDFNGVKSETPFDKINMLNVDDDLTSSIKYGDIHPEVAREYMDLMMFTKNMNSKEGGVTQQDIATQKEMLSNLTKKTDEIKQRAIAFQPTKALKAAQSEWFANGGRMKQGINAAEVTASNLNTRPDFGGDTALNSAWDAFAGNVLVDISGSSESITDEDGNIKKGVLLDNLLAQTIVGKKSNAETIIKNMSTPNAQGKTPLQVYAGLKAKKVLIAAVLKLAENNPQVKQLMFDSNGQPNGWQTSGAIVAKKLAELSLENQLLDGSLSNNYLNFKLQESLDKVLAENAFQWNEQQSMDQGSFMVNLFKNRQPFKIVDDVISQSWGRNVNGMWNLAVQNKSDTVTQAKSASSRRTERRKEQRQIADQEETFTNRPLSRR